MGLDVGNGEIARWLHRFAELVELVNLDLIHFYILRPSIVTTIPITLLVSILGLAVGLLPQVLIQGITLAPVQELVELLVLDLLLLNGLDNALCRILDLLLL